MADTYRLQESPVPPPEPAQQPEPAPPGEPRPPKEPRTRSSTPRAPGRLVSLDAYRGFIMVLLAASGFGIARLAALPDDAALWQQPVSDGDTLREPTAEEIAARRQRWETWAFHFSHPSWRSDFLPYPTDNPAGQSPWLRIGVSFWDLIQPAFMFMVGVAMPFSYRRRTSDGDSWWKQARHAFVRAVVLVLLGVFLYSIGHDRTNWGFTNVLAQIGLGYFFVFLLARLRWQLLATSIVLILAGTWYFMQFGYWQLSGKPQPDGSDDSAAVAANPAAGEVLPGRFAPWSKNDNAFHEGDLWLLNALRDPGGNAMTAWRQRQARGSLPAGDWLAMSVRRILFANPEEHAFNAGGYTTLNFVPSIATMLLGVLCGRLLLSDVTRRRKFLWLLVGGLVCLLLGRALGVYAIPIVKRIWTPSWALFSGAYAIWMLALFYLLFDLLPLKKLAFPLVIVGMNSIAMYMLGQLMRPFTIRNVITPHGTGLLETLLGTDPVTDGRFYLLADDMYGRILFPVVTLLIFWLIALWLYRKRIFIRI